VICIRFLPNETKILKGGTRFDVPRVQTTRPANVEGILQTQVMRELPQRRRPSSFRLGDFWGWRCREQQRSLGWQWGKEMFVTGSHRKKMEEQEQRAREEDERTMRREEE
jgi:hypothetical protein